MPLLEAVVNGVQALDARFGDDIERERLTVKVRRSPQDGLASAPPAPAVRR